MRNLDILAAENGEHIRVLLCGEEQCYVVSCQHFRMPYPVASDLLAELQPVPAEAYSVFVLDEDITNRQREGRNRKLDLIAPLLDDTCIYIVDLNSRFPQGIILCNGAVLYILMQMVPGKKSLQAVCITHRARS